MATSGECTFSMNVHIMATTKADAAQMKTEMKEFVQATCAAFNSERREVFKIRNVNQGVTQKYLDEWRKEVEEELFKTLKPPLCKDNFEFCSESTDAEFLCCYITPITRRPTTVSYNLRLPTDTSTELVEDYQQVMTILLREEERATSRPFFDFDEHLPKAKEPESPGRAASSVSANAEGHFRGLLDLKMGDTVKIPESKTVQYKKLKNGKKLAINIESHASDYIGAFANHEGGWIIVGVQDDNCEVVGQMISEETKDEIIQCLEKCAKRKIWGRRQEVPVRGRHWDVYFHLLGEEDMYLVEVRVYPFYGGVFQKEPESYSFEVNDDGERVIVKTKFGVWMEAMLREKITGMYENENY